MKNQFSLLHFSGNTPIKEHDKHIICFSFKKGVICCRESPIDRNKSIRNENGKTMDLLFH